MKNEIDIKDFNKKVQYFSFIMTCIVLLYHCPIIVGGGSDLLNKSYFSEIILTLCVYAMGFFFCITGFRLFDNLNFKNYLDKIKRRIKTLLIPYIIWQVIGYIIKSIFIDLPIKTFILNTFFIYDFPPDGPLWYIYAIFLLSLLSPILLLAYRNEKFGFTTITLLIISSRVIIEMEFFKQISDYGYMFNILTYLPAYLFGTFVGAFKDKIKVDKIILYGLIIILIFIILQPILPNSFMKIFLNIVPFIIILIIPNIKKLENKKIYKLSFLIYATHSFIIEFINHFLSEYYDKVSNTFVALACNILIRIFYLGLTIFITAIIYKILEKKMPKILSLITGGRK